MGTLTNSVLESAPAATSSWVLRLLPSLSDLFFLLPAVWLFSWLGGTATLLSDGDTGWHIRTGEWIWSHGAVPKADIFSFTKPGEPWYAWEWLWDLLFAGIHHAGGLSAVAFVTICLLGIMSVLTFRMVRRTTDNDLVAAAVATLAVAGTSIHWLARPHLFSMLFVLAFAHLLLSVKQGKTSALLLLPLLMILWTNLHGGFFLGILMLLLAAAGEVAGAFLHAANFLDAAYYRSRKYLACAGACAAATLLNPYGWLLHKHIVEYLFASKLIDYIGEYQSLSFHWQQSKPFEALLFLAVVAAFWAFAHKQYSVAISIPFWAHVALYSARNIPVFALLSAPAIGAMLASALRRAESVARLRHIVVRITALAQRMKPIERSPRLHVFSALALLLFAFSFASGVEGFEGKFNDKNFPSTALPFIRNAKFARLFTTDTWASYFVYQLYPKQASFFDGRSDFYGYAFLDEYADVVNGHWNWEKILDRYAVDGVALQPDRGLVAALKLSPHWRLVFDDGSVVVFKRVSAAPAQSGSVTRKQVSSAGDGRRKKLGRTGQA